MFETFQFAYELAFFGGAGGNNLFVNKLIKNVFSEINLLTYVVFRHESDMFSVSYQCYPHKSHQGEYDVIAPENRHTQSFFMVTLICLHHGLKWISCSCYYHRNYRTAFYSVVHT